MRLNARVRALMRPVKGTLIRAQWILGNQLGIDPARFVSGLAAIPGYLLDRYRFARSLRAAGLNSPMAWYPAVHERDAEAGDFGEYFWQDLLVARMILDARPTRHFDIGSRIDGFVAHVAASRTLEVIDIRPLTSVIPNVTFRQADMMGDLPPELLASCDSLSCLHTIEHFGLGRYGDPIDAMGLAKGIANISKIIAPGGTVYLSTPVGRERIEFNAHRVSNPSMLVDLAGRNGLELLQVFSVEGDSIVEHDSKDAALQHLSEYEYSLGIFIFKRSLPA